MTDDFIYYMGRPNHFWNKSVCEEMQHMRTKPHTKTLRDINFLYYSFVMEMVFGKTVRYDSVTGFTPN